MMHFSIAVLAVAFAQGAQPSDAKPEHAQAQGKTGVVLELREGRQIVGEIVADKPTAYFVDLGYDVIRVPKDQVLSKTDRDSTKTPAVGSGGGAVVRSSDYDASGFFQVSALKSKPVKELVEQFGEAVISIETPGGKGSGFIINDLGYAITNNHVIQGETKITAVLYPKTPNGLVRRTIENVEIIAINPFVDLALIKLPPQKDLKLEHVYLGSMDEVSPGEGVFAVGNPLGFERSVSQGVLSNRSRNFEGQVYLQTDAAINPGNSGGPLFNMKGEVIGVTSLKITFGDNLGFAIPITYVKDFIRNRDAFAFNKDNPNSGHRYLDPPRRRKSGPPRVAAEKEKASQPSLGKPDAKEGVR